MVQPWAANVRSSSPLGTGVRPSTRVSTSDWDTLGRVNSQFRAAAAANTLDTPGITR